MNGDADSPTQHASDLFLDAAPLRLPPDLDAAIAAIFQSDDPLDASDFDPVDYINVIFPNEQALASVDKVLVQLRTKIRRMDLDIRELIRLQADAGKNTVAELEAAKRAIQVCVCAPTAESRKASAAVAHQMNPSSPTIKDD